MPNGDKSGPRPLPEADVVAAYTEGRSLRSIAAEYGVPDRRVMRLLDQHGIKRRPRKVAMQLPEADIRSRYESGQSIRSIAADLSLSQGTISRYLQEAGIKKASTAGQLPEAEIAESYTQGSTLAELAAEHGVVDSTILRVLDRAGVERRRSAPPRPAQTDIPDAEIRRLFREGTSASVLARRYGVSLRTIYRRLTEKPEGM